MGSDNRGIVHWDGAAAPSLHGEPLEDGQLLEVETEHGWIRGHFRDRLHPETGAIAFELHLPHQDERISHDHHTIFLPPTAVLRLPRPELGTVAGNRPD